jgi:hypothetical protein
LVTVIAVDTTLFLLLLAISLHRLRLPLPAQSAPPEPVV